MILTDKEYNSIYSKVPRVCIDLVIKSGGGVLLTKRTTPPYKGKWNFPGGRIRFRENFKKAANRIAKREIGVSVKLIKLLGCMEFLMEVQNGCKRHTVSLVFEAVPNKEPNGETFHYVTKNVLSVHAKFLKSNNILK